jgi:uncharacterized membrane protein YfcA
MTAAVVLVLGFAALIRSAFGFGEALIAVPLLALVLPVQVAAPVAVLASITIAALVLLQDWSDVHVRSAGWLVLSTAAGIPIGLLALTRVAEPLVKGALAVVIIAFSLYSLLSRRRLALHDDRTAWLFGFAAGVLGGAYGMNGPPLVVYGGLRGWSPRHFRATLQAYFLPASLLGVIGYWSVGLWTRVVLHDFLVALPAIVVATFAGRALNRRIDAARFLTYVHVALILIGALLLAQALSGAAPRAP